MSLVCPKQESNLQTLGFKPSRSAGWRIRARVVPDGLEPPLPGCRPGVVGAGPRDYVSGSRGTRTHNGVTAAGCKTGSSSVRMTSVLQDAWAGVASTVERSARHSIPIQGRDAMTQRRRAALNPEAPGAKPGSVPIADPRESPLGIEPTSQAWKAVTSAARPRAHQAEPAGI